MADIFISYSREDRTRVELLAEALAASGYSVWWDRQISTGARFLETTEAELDAAKAVVVVWTRSSICSHWVADEAGAGRDSGRMVPVSLDGSFPPLGFRQFQVTDLSGWKPDDDASLDELHAALRRLINSPEPVRRPAAHKAGMVVPKRALWIGGAAAAGVALFFAISLFALRPSGGLVLPPSQRIAFFGFTANDDDPDAVAMAAAATDQMFENMGAVSLDSIARTETLGTPVNERFARARQLGALYALSGEVRPDKLGTTLSIRFEDVPSRMTLWDQPVGALALETATLPVRAAYRTNSTMRCIVQRRPKLTHETSALIILVADTCRNGSYNTGSNDAWVNGRRALAQADPKSAHFQAILALALAQTNPGTLQSVRTARMSEAEAALQHAERLDPNEAAVADAPFKLARAKGASLTEQEENLGRAITALEGKDPYFYADAIANHALLARRVGRWRDSQTYLSMAISNDPLRRLRDLGYVFAMNGLASKARAEFEQDFARDPSPEGWEMWISASVFLGVGDADDVLTAPPAWIPKGTVVCWREIRKAYTSKNARSRMLGARRASKCGASGDITPPASLGAQAALGDLDAAFGLANGQAINTSARAISKAGLEALFWPTSSAMRADQRFLPLVEKLGLMDYWRATRTHPDVCETESAPFCSALDVTSKS